MFDNLTYLTSRVNLTPLQLNFCIGSKVGYTYNHGYPLVRIQLARKLSEQKGFARIAEVLQRPDLPWMGTEVLFHLLNTMQLNEVRTLI
jgi:hypothetical protein